MKILARLNNKYGGRVLKDIHYQGSLEQAKVDLYYIEYDGGYYEWGSYKAGYADCDYEADYGQIGAVPGNARIYKIANINIWAPRKCECGSKTVMAPGHSHWCPLFNG